MSTVRVGAPRSAWLAGGAAIAAGWAWMGLPAAAALIAGPAVIAAAFAARGTRRRTWQPRAVALGFGLLLLAVRLIAGPAGVSPPVLDEGQAGPWTAVVESMGSPREGHQTARLRLQVDRGELIVAATLPAYPEVAAGELIVIDGRLRPPPPDDPYGEYLTRTGASGTLQARSVRVPDQPSQVTLQAVRDGAGDALRTALPEPEAGLAAGILIGLRERVDRQLAADFATAGVSHVVAISGWNIAIVAGLVGAMLRGRPKRLVAVVVAGTIVAYVIAAGASPSVVRAAVMASVVLVARETGRAGRAPAALAWAAAILLLVDPRMIGDAGFRLSVLATAGLLAWANPLATRIRTASGGRVPGWLAESLGISLAAQAATLPDVVATFGRLSLVAPFVNLAVVPLVPLAMAGGVIALAGGALAALGAPSVIATLLGLPGWLLLHVIVAMVRIGAAIPFAAVEVPTELALPFAGLVAVGIAAGIALLPVVRGGRRRRRSATPAAARAAAARRSSSGSPARTRVGPARLGTSQRVLLIGLVVLIAIGSTAVANAAGRETRLTVLDVGQGDAILVESRGGARMLVDGGPDPDRLLLELDARIPPWDRRIDVIVLTHPHEDHVAGLVRVLARYSVGRVYEPGMRGPGPGWAAWDKALRDGPPRGQLATGARIELGEIRLTVLWPDPGSVPVEPAATGAGINDVSIVLLGEAQGRRFLLTGDIEQGVDPTLVARGLPHVDVLKVAHHGSATATTQAFLDAVRPAVAAISVGTGNPYGHPAHATLSRLAASGARVLRTDLDGSIEADLRADAVVVRTTGGRSTAGAAWSPAVRAASLGYDPYHDRPDAPPGRPPALLARPARMARAAFVRRRGHRRVAGGTSTLERSGRGRRAGRRRGAAARRGQAALGRGARPPPPRRRLRLVACRPGLAGARSARTRPPGHEACRAGACHLVADGKPRGPDRGLRRQARRPAP